MSFRARLSLGAALAAPLTLLSFGLAHGAAAGQSSCRLEALPPTLYAGDVFGMGRVVCSTPANKVAITVVLEQDGVEVARLTRNDCRKIIVCWNTTVRVPDEPGGQVWCSRVSGTATGADLGEARACEADEF